VPVGRDEAFSGVMLVYVPAGEALGARLVSLFSSNRP
jgi:hypothetical protein